MDLVRHVVLPGALVAVSLGAVRLAAAATDELYVTNQRTVTVYPRTATGDTPPSRTIVIAGNPSALTRGAGVDPDRGDIFVIDGSLLDTPVLVFDINADGPSTPIRSLRGPRTGISNAYALAVDLVHRELYVGNVLPPSITVYDPDAAGDTPPKRTITAAALKEPIQ